jgi:hypothetical protein
MAIVLKIGKPNREDEPAPNGITMSWKIAE